MPRNRKVVVVTGASSGFGRLTAEHLARHGYRVFATMREAGGRNADRARALRELAGRESLDMQVAEMDVDEDASVDACLGEVAAAAGRIDVLVNNAGFGYMGLLESFTLAQAKRIFETNVFGVLRTIRAVLPHMRRQGEGLLIQVSSGAGRVVIPTMALYCASKFAVEALSETCRYELASEGIDSVCIEPGAYPTEIFGKITGGADKAREAAYGAARGIAPKVGAALTSSAADPAEIPDAILRIIETPRGRRAVRYRVGKGAKGVEAINAVCADAQEEALTAFGIAELTRQRGEPASSGNGT